jgi:hypothetical protein
MVIGFVGLVLPAQVDLSSAPAQWRSHGSSWTYCWQSLRMCSPHPQASHRNVLGTIAFTCSLAQHQSLFVLIAILGYRKTNWSGNVEP